MPNYYIEKKDAVEWLRGLPDESIDLVITDPPYESLEKYRKIGTTTRLKNWFEIFPNERFDVLFFEIHRILKKNAHLYVFTDVETMFVVKPIATRAGFHFWKPLIWNKMRIGMGYHYRSQYEFILFFEKGKRKLNNLSIPDILEERPIRNGSYPTAKPPELIEYLVTQSSERGELICDPFCGSGSTGVAALKQGRNFAGCDTSSRALELTEKELHLHSGQLTLGI